MLHQVRRFLIYDVSNFLNKELIEVIGNFNRFMESVITIVDNDVISYLEELA